MLGFLVGLAGLAFLVVGVLMVANVIAGSLVAGIILAVVGLVMLVWAYGGVNGRTF